MILLWFSNDELKKRKWAFNNKMMIFFYIHNIHTTCKIISKTYLCSIIKQSLTCVPENQRWGIFVIAIICLLQKILFIDNTRVCETWSVSVWHSEGCSELKNNITMLQCSRSTNLIICTKNIILLWEHY